MALSAAQADWAAAKNRNEYVAILTFDLSATSDTISVGALSQNLRNAGIHNSPLKWIENYMSGHSQ